METSGREFFVEYLEKAENVYFSLITHFSSGLFGSRTAFRCWMLNRRSKN